MRKFIITILTRLILWLDRAEIQEPTGETIIMLGRYAAQLVGMKDGKPTVKNPALNTAFLKVEADIFYAWKTSPPKDAEARERLYYRMEGLAEIKVKLLGMVQNMLIEENKLKQKRGQSA